MKKTTKTETTLEIGDANDGLILTADHEPGRKPTEVFVQGCGGGRMFPIETLLRVAEAIKVAGWVPDGVAICPDRGFVSLADPEAAR
jgi:hypothetical protein